MQTTFSFRCRQANFSSFSDGLFSDLSPSQIFPVIPAQAENRNPDNRKHLFPQPIPETKLPSARSEPRPTQRNRAVRTSENPPFPHHVPHPRGGLITIPPYPPISAARREKMRQNCGMPIFKFHCFQRDNA
ncbi:hypothetical protein [Neisseria sp.]|uniref:hypothetical protein n=1 Tax=Neisseria sp. TaxID=192066 RepID=UPI0035A1A235